MPFAELWDAILVEYSMTAYGYEEENYDAAEWPPPVGGAK